MKDFLGRCKEKLFDLKDFHMLPRFVLGLIRKYLRLEVEGLEYVPQKGRAIILPNHSGWSGFDAVMIGHEIYMAKKRIPRILAHHAFFMNELKSFVRKMGMEEAKAENGVRLLKKNNIVILFPEGERGNFKPTSERYQLQEFKRGFVRMALATGAPIIPTIVIGAEETHINLGQFKFKKPFLRNQIFPLPLNILPLPAKWKIKFLEPVDLSSHSPEKASDAEFVHKIALEIQAKMQMAINEALKSRKWIYFPIN